MEKPLRNTSRFVRFHTFQGDLHMKKINGKAVVNADECIDCGACVGACPTEAIAQ